MTDFMISQLGGGPIALAHEHCGASISAANMIETLQAKGQEAPTSAHRAGPVMIERGERFAVHRGVAVMPIRGILTPNSEMLERWLGWATYRGIEESVEAIISDDTIDAVVLDVDSPGGMILGMDGASDALARLAQVKPVYSLVNPMAASAAYHLVARTTRITVTPGAIVGSIGTMRMSVTAVKAGYSGHKWSEHVSQHARAKNPDGETDIGKTEIQRSLNESEASFHAVVAAGRNIPLAELTARLSVTDDVADGGAVFWGQAGIERGLADELATRSEFYEGVLQAHAPKVSKTKVRGYLARAAAAEAIAQL